MNKKRTLFFALSLLSMGAFAQELALTSDVPQPIVKLSYLDSVKSTFVRNQDMARIDSLWMNELTNEDLFADMQADLKTIDPDVEVDYNLSTTVLKQRLAALDAKSPFNIEYSKGLENIIKSFLKNRHNSYERLMAISEYYFPMFEERLAQYNVPLELKYLAIIESALNPRAKSPVGASGLWQFMYPTGKQYNLNVDSYVDERLDPLKATEAACQYLSSLYNIFGDWDLVLASYNAGPGNVTKAIRRSGSYKNYWNIRKNLPKETQAYNPTFLATMYIYEYAREHGINGKRAKTTYFETDTIMVKRKMSFKQIASLVDVPVSELQFLNPTYKLDVIPHTEGKAHFLRLPKDKVALFVSNENSIYAYIDHEEAQRERPYWVNGREESVAAYTPKRSKNSRNTKTTYKTHTVKSGDALGSIADKYGVSLAELRKWNRIKGNMIHPGQKLKIQKTITVKETLAVEEPEQAIAATVAKDSTPAKKVVVPTGKTALAATTAKDAADTNPQVAANDDNQTNDGDATTATEAKTGIATVKKRETSYEEAALYIVQKGDSLFSIARQHPGVTVENLKTWNKINGESIKPGMKLKIGDN
ncbi:LysM peptidoglycan-binding domain-containing protein [Flavobacterium sp. RHBU_24]|uniref:lytic transglycosylase domain-containing protein n=1 Tax=Flavobacterium sp. RHBU_24 TaxID=3391185 RepID=UPI003984AB53